MDRKKYNIKQRTLDMGKDVNILLEAKISAKLSIIAKIVLWAMILIFIIIGFTCFEHSSSDEYNEWVEYCFWGIRIYRDWFYLTVSYDWKYDGRSYNPVGIIIIMMIVIFLLLLPMIINKILEFIGKRCNLTLTENMIFGEVNTLFRKNQIRIPIEKIDYIVISDGIINKFFKGKTLKIGSNNGRINFPWVQNAKEFSDATLAKIDEYKQSVNEKNENLVSSALNHSVKNAGTQSAAQKIRELKELLEIGAISQEEFEVKRKELLEKI